MPEISRRLVAVLAVAAFVVAMVAGRLVSGGDAAAPASEAPAATIVSPPAVVVETLLVHVVGAVRHPGVYRLPPGARAQDAVRRAGGATRRAVLAGLNLAARLVDGEQLVVPRAGGPGGPPPAAVEGPVSLSSANAAALDELPGVGPATAQRIVAWREAHGPFRTVDDLLDVPGIGPAKLAAMRDRLVP